MNMYYSVSSYDSERSWIHFFPTREEAEKFIDLVAKDCDCSKSDFIIELAPLRVYSTAEKAYRAWKEN